MAKHAKDRTLILHLGLHKTATSYLQNVLGALRYDLLREGVLYPSTGVVDGLTTSTRDGAQSGHALFTRDGPGWQRLLPDLLNEIPDTASTVLMSSEDFSLARRKITPEQYVKRFSAFGTIKVVLVLRRQDTWIESYYKQMVDQYGNFETRSFAEFLQQEGPRLLDFHRRFTPWRELVGPDNFHVLSYDDLPDAATICRRILQIAGIKGTLLDQADATTVPRYDSVRAIDTLGLRILNSYRLEDPDDRAITAKSIYSMAPNGDIELMTPEVQAGIEQFCAPINERIETEWFTEPVPGFKFGSTQTHSSPTPPTGPEIIDYLDHVLSLCEATRKRHALRHVLPGHSVTATVA